MTDTISLPAAAFILRQPQGEHSPAAGAEPAPEAMDLIFIEGFEGPTVIGINPDEHSLPQLVRIDLVAGVPRSRACETDQISDTIDYGAVHGAITHLLASHRLKLLEALAEAIAALLLDTFGAHWVRVVLVKPRKFANVAAVGVAIERRRHIRGSRPGQPGDEGSVSFLWRSAPAL